VGHDVRLTSTTVETSPVGEGERVGSLIVRSRPTRRLAEERYSIERRRREGTNDHRYITHYPRRTAVVRRLDREREKWAKDKEIGAIYEGEWY
jgi:hypothetical protein